MNYQDELRDLDQLTELLADGITPYELNQDRRTQLSQRIADRIHTPAPDGTTTLRAAEGDWVNVMDLVDMKVLRQDAVNRNHTVLYRMHPGAVFPNHTHTQEEECLVLEGEIIIGDHYLHAGDWHVAQPGYEHPVIRSKTGAVLLVRTAMD